MMKAITKAKRRVTLSISGLGLLDETEVGPTDDDLIAEHDAPAEPVAHQIALPQLPNNAGTDWRTFGNNLVAILRQCENKSDIFEWLGKNKQTLDRWKRSCPRCSRNSATQSMKSRPNQRDPVSTPECHT